LYSAIYAEHAPCTLTHALIFLEGNGVKMPSDRKYAGEAMVGGNLEEG